MKRAARGRLLLLVAVLLGLLAMHTSPAMAMPSPTAGPAVMVMLAQNHAAPPQQVPVQQLPWHDGQGEHHMVSPCVSSPVRLLHTSPVPPGMAPAAPELPAAVRPASAPAVGLRRPWYLEHADPQDLGICRT